MLLTIFRVTGGNAPRLKHSLGRSFDNFHVASPHEWDLLIARRLPATFSSLPRLLHNSALFFVFVFSTQPRGSPCSQPEIIELVRTLEPNSSEFFLWTNCTNAASGPSLERILAPFNRWHKTTLYSPSQHAAPLSSRPKGKLFPPQNSTCVFLYSGSNSSTKRSFPRERRELLLVLRLYLQYYSM